MFNMFTLKNNDLAHPYKEVLELLTELSKVFEDKLGFFDDTLPRHTGGPASRFRAVSE